MVTQTEGDDESTLNENISFDGIFDQDVTEIMDIDIIADADVDVRGEYMADADFGNFYDAQNNPYDQIAADVDVFVDEVMDVDGVAADVDTGINIVTTATSLTP